MTTGLSCQDLCLRIVIIIITFIERRDYGGVLSEDCEDTEQSSEKVSDIMYLGFHPGHHSEIICSALTMLQAGSSARRKTAAMT